MSAHLFWEKGFSATTTREIAARAGIEKASLYHHIDRKDDLLHAICSAALDDIHRSVVKAVKETSDPAQRVHRLISAHVTTMIERRYEHATMLAEMRALSPARRDEVIGKRDQYEALIQEVLSDAQTASALRSDVPAKYLRLALLNLLNWSIFWYRPEGTLSSSQLSELLYNLFVSGAEPKEDGTNSLPSPQARPSAGEKERAAVKRGERRRR